MIKESIFNQVMVLKQLKMITNEEKDEFFSRFFLRQNYQAEKGNDQFQEYIQHHIKDNQIPLNSTSILLNEQATKLFVGYSQESSFPEDQPHYHLRVYYINQQKFSHFEDLLGKLQLHDHSLNSFLRKNETLGQKSQHFAFKKKITNLTFGINEDELIFCSHRVYKVNLSNDYAGHRDGFSTLIKKNKNHQLSDQEEYVCLKMDQEKSRIFVATNRKILILDRITLRLEKFIKIQNIQQIILRNLLIDLPEIYFINRDSSIKIFKIDPNSHTLDYYTKPQIIQCHTKKINKIEFGYDDDNIFSCSIDGSIACSNIHTKQVVYKLQCDAGSITNFLFFQNNEESFILSCSEFGSIIQWNLTDKSIEETYEIHKGPIQKIFLSKDNSTLCTCSEDSSFSQYSLTQKQQKLKFYQDNEIRDFYYNEHHNIIICQSNLKVNIYNIIQDKYRHRINLAEQDSREIGNNIFFIEEKNLLIAAKNQFLTFFDTEDINNKKVIETEHVFIEGIKYFEKGDILIIYGEDKVTFIDLKNEKTKYEENFNLKQDRVSIKFSSEKLLKSNTTIMNCEIDYIRDQLIVTFDSICKIFVYSENEGFKLFELNQQLLLTQSAIKSLKFVKDGNILLALGSEDMAIIDYQNLNRQVINKTLNQSNIKKKTKYNVQDFHLNKDHSELYLIVQSDLSQQLTRQIFKMKRIDNMFVLEQYFEFTFPEKILNIKYFNDENQNQQHFYFYTQSVFGYIDINDAVLNTDKVGVSKRMINNQIKVIKDQVQLYADESLEIPSESDFDEQFDFGINLEDELMQIKKINCKISEFKKIHSTIRKIKYSAHYERAYVMCVDQLFTLEIQDVDFWEQKQYTKKHLINDNRNTYHEIEFPKDERDMYVLDNRNRIFIVNLSSNTVKHIIEQNQVEQDNFYFNEDLSNIICYEEGRLIQYIKNLHSNEYFLNQKDLESDDFGGFIDIIVDEQSQIVYIVFQKAIQKFNMEYFSNDLLYLRSIKNKLVIFSVKEEQNSIQDAQFNSENNYIYICTDKNFVILNLNNLNTYTINELGGTMFQVDYVNNKLYIVATFDSTQIKHPLYYELNLNVIHDKILNINQGENVNGEIKQVKPDDKLEGDDTAIFESKEEQANPFQQEKQKDLFKQISLMKQEIKYVFSEDFSIFKKSSDVESIEIVCDQTLSDIKKLFHQKDIPQYKVCLYFKDTTLFMGNQILEKNKFETYDMFTNKFDEKIKFSKDCKKIFSLSDNTISIINLELNEVEKKYEFYTEQKINFHLNNDQTKLYVYTSPLDIQIIELKYSSNFYLMMDNLNQNFKKTSSYSEIQAQINSNSNIIEQFHNIMNNIVVTESSHYDLFFFFSGIQNKKLFVEFVNQINSRSCDSSFYQLLFKLQQQRHQLTKKQNVGSLFSSYFLKYFSKKSIHEIEQDNNFQRQQTEITSNARSLFQVLNKNFKKFITKIANELPENFKLTSEDAWAILSNVNYINYKSMKVLAHYYAIKLDEPMEINVLKNQNQNTYQQKKQYFHYSYHNNNFQYFGIFSNYDSFQKEKKNNSQKYSIAKQQNFSISDYKNNKTQSYDKYQTKIGFDIRLGSPWSIELFSNLIKAAPPIREKFRSIINYKFDKIWFHLFIYSLYYLILNICFVLQNFNESHHTVFFVLTLIFAFILLSIETMQFLSYKIGTQLNFYNSLDFITLSLVVIMSIINETQEINQTISVFNLISVFLLNVRSLLELRIFTPFRYLLRVILNVFTDLFPFVVVTVQFIFIYACLLKGANELYNRDDESYWSMLKPSFHLAYGQYETDDSNSFESVDWIIFIFSGFILIILNLNLVIAIVNQTFEQYQNQQEEVDIEDQLEMIVNMDELFNVKSFLSKIKVTFLTILFCKNPKKLQKYFEKKQFDLFYFQFFYPNDQQDKEDEQNGGVSEDTIIELSQKFETEIKNLKTIIQTQKNDIKEISQNLSQMKDLFIYFLKNQDQNFLPKMQQMNPHFKFDLVSRREILDPNKKNQEKLDEGNTLEFRIKKTDMLRTLNYDLEESLKQYISGLSIISEAEKKISLLLESLYYGNSSYEQLIKDLQASIKRKEEIILKDISSIQMALNNKKKIEEQFKPIRPYVKDYFNQKKELEHRKIKLPKLRTQIEAKEKLKGQLNKKEIERLNRNERKHNEAISNYEISSQNIIKETNKINLERFKYFNPIIGEFISSLLSQCYLMEEHLHKLDNHENILKLEETEDFNDRFFLNVKEQSKIHYKGIQEIQNGTIVKQNVQNNYYYVGQNKDENSHNQQNPQGQIPMQNQISIQQQQMQALQDHQKNNSQQQNKAIPLHPQAIPMGQ